MVRSAVLLEGLFMCVFRLKTGCCVRYLMIGLVWVGLIQGAWAAIQESEGKGYRCTIMDLSRTTDKGFFVKQFLYRVNVRPQTFWVDRNQGLVRGDVFDNVNAQEIRIIDRGSEQQAFKLLSVFGPMMTIDYLQIKEYKEGAQKPFTGMSQGKAFSGLCQVVR